MTNASRAARMDLYRFENYEENEDDLEELRKWLGKIKRRDFVGGEQELGTNDPEVSLLFRLLGGAWILSKQICTPLLEQLHGKGLPSTVHRSGTWGKTKATVLTHP